MTRDGLIDLLQSTYPFIVTRSRVFDRYVIVNNVENIAFNLRMVSMIHNPLAWSGGEMYTNYLDYRKEAVYTTIILETHDTNNHIRGIFRFVYNNKCGAFSDAFYVENSFNFGMVSDAFFFMLLDYNIIINMGTMKQSEYDSIYRRWKINKILNDDC